MKKSNDGKEKTGPMEAETVADKARRARVDCNFPDSWQAATEAQLQHLIDFGSYGQALAGQFELRARRAK